MPVSLYRLGLGGFERLYGMRWILVTTAGRRTGNPHSVLLDVLSHDAGTDTYYVQPAYGRGADWVQNIEKNPLVDAQVGRRRFRARALAISGEEGAERMMGFIHDHPVEWWMIGWMLGIKPPPEVKSGEQLQRWLAGEFLYVGIRPTAGG